MNTSSFFILHTLDNYQKQFFEIGFEVLTKRLIHKISLIILGLQTTKYTRRTYKVLHLV